MARLASVGVLVPLVWVAVCVVTALALPHPGHTTSKYAAAGVQGGGRHFAGDDARVPADAHMPAPPLPPGPARVDHVPRQKQGYRPVDIGLGHRVKRGKDWEWVRYLAFALSATRLSVTLSVPPPG